MIKVRLLDILKQQERNLNWLSLKTEITYSTLYNFAHQNTSAVSYEILDKLCVFLNCNTQDIIEYIPNEK